MANDNRSNRGLAVVLSGIVLLAAMMFITTGGDLGGTQKVEGDHDLPKVASPRPPAGTVGTTMAPEGSGGR